MRSHNLFFVTPPMIPIVTMKTPTIACTRRLHLYSRKSEASTSESSFQTEEKAFSILGVTWFAVCLFSESLSVISVMAVFVSPVYVELGGLCSLQKMKRHLVSDTPRSWSHNWQHCDNGAPHTESRSAMDVWGPMLFISSLWLIVSTWGGIFFWILGVNREIFCHVWAGWHKDQP